MRIFAVALFFVFVNGSSIARQVSLPAAEPSYNSSYPKYRYDLRAPSLQQIDFRNLKVFWFAGEQPDSGARLRNGTFERKADSGYERVDLDFVKFFGSTASEEQYAVIDLKWWDCGGSCTVVGRVQVFELEAGHPTVVQEIEYDRHAPRTGSHFDARTKTLTIVGRSNDHTPNCCPKNLDVLRFDWNGERFVFRESETIPASSALSSLKR